MKPNRILAGVLALMSTLAGAGPSFAEAGGAGDAPVVVGTAQVQDAPGPCVEVRIGTAHAGRFDCLNAEMASLADQAEQRGADLQSIVDDQLPSAPSRLGLYNQAATREHLGGNFGRSPYPLRPVTVYRNPLIH